MSRPSKFRAKLIKIILNYANICTLFLSFPQNVQNTSKNKHYQLALNRYKYMTNWLMEKTSGALEKTQKNTVENIFIKNFFEIGNNYVILQTLLFVTITYLNQNNNH